MRATFQAAASAPDWSGGTRLGEALRRFNDQWGMRGVARGADLVERQLLEPPYAQSHVSPRKSE